MVDLLKDRIKAILKEKGTWIKALVGGSETQRSKISHQLNSDASITLPTIMLILDSFPDISAEYLLRGIGGMYVQDHLEPRIYNTNSTVGIQSGGTHSPQTITAASDATLQAQIDGLLNLLAMKDEAIAYRDKTIEELRSDKRFLNTQLNTLLIKIKKQA